MLLSHKITHGHVQGVKSQQWDNLLLPILSVLLTATQPLRGLTAIARKPQVCKDQVRSNPYMFSKPRILYYMEENATR